MKAGVTCLTVGRREKQKQNVILVIALFSVENPDAHKQFQPTTGEEQTAL